MLPRSLWRMLRAGVAARRSRRADGLWLAVGTSLQLAWPNVRDLTQKPRAVLARDGACALLPELSWLRATWRTCEHTRADARTRRDGAVAVGACAQWNLRVANCARRHVHYRTALTLGRATCGSPCVLWLIAHQQARIFDDVRDANVPFAADIWHRAAAAEPRTASALPSLASRRARLRRVRAIWLLREQTGKRSSAAERASGLPPLSLALRRALPRRAACPRRCGLFAPTMRDAPTPICPPPVPRARRFALDCRLSPPPAGRRAWLCAWPSFKVALGAASSDAPHSGAHNSERIAPPSARFSIGRASFSLVDRLKPRVCFRNTLQNLARPPLGRPRARSACSRCPSRSPSSSSSPCRRSSPSLPRCRPSSRAPRPPRPSRPFRPRRNRAATPNRRPQQRPRSSSRPHARARRAHRRVHRRARPWLR